MRIRKARSIQPKKKAAAKRAKSAKPETGASVPARAAGEAPVPAQEVRKAVSRQMVRKARRWHNKKSGLEKTVEGWCSEAGLNFRTQAPIGRCHVDILFPDTNTVLELNGCYFHGHTRCRPRDKDGHTKPLSRRQMRKHVQDAKRYKFLLGRGYNLVLIWECDVNKKPDATREEVLSHGRRS